MALNTERFNSICLWEKSPICDALRLSCIFVSGKYVHKCLTFVFHLQTDYGFPGLLCSHYCSIMLMESKSTKVTPDLGKCST